MSASTTAAVAPKTSGEDIPWNPKVRQHKTPGDWVVDIIIVAILVAVVFVTIYPLWFIVIASLLGCRPCLAGRGVPAAQGH